MYISLRVAALRDLAHVRVDRPQPIDLRAYLPNGLKRIDFCPIKKGQLTALNERRRRQTPNFASLSISQQTSLLLSHPGRPTPQVRRRTRSPIADIPPESIARNQGLTMGAGVTFALEPAPSTVRFWLIETGVLFASPEYVAMT